MLTLGGVAADLASARLLAESALADGRAWERFRQLVNAQGGDVRYINDPAKLASARLVEPLLASQSGYLRVINARTVGETSVLLGGGRAKKGDPIDYGVGVIVHHKVGDFVETGQPLFTLHANDPEKLAQAQEYLLNAVFWSAEPVDPLPLFYGVIA